MSRELNEAFLRDPVRFMQRNMAVVPGFIPGRPARMLTTPNNALLVADQFGQGWQPNNIPAHPHAKCLAVRRFGADPMDTWSLTELYVDILDQLEMVPPQVGISFSNQPNEGDAHFPCWFLPWIPNGLTSIRLTGGPRFFFTSSLSGCSVWVTGPTDRPTVYHGNARDLIVQNDVNIQPADQDYVNYMDALFNHMMAHTAAPHNQLRQKITKLQYMRPDYHLQRKRNAGRLIPDLVNPNDVRPDGWSAESSCVFGFRRGNRWKFYIQENVSMRYGRAVHPLLGHHRRGDAFEGIRSLVRELPADPNV